MQFAFLFSQRLVTIGSPVEFPSVIAEFTNKRISLLRKHSIELAELSTQRWKLLKWIDPSNDVSFCNIAFLIAHSNSARVISAPAIASSCTAPRSRLLSLAIQLRLAGPYSGPSQFAQAYSFFGSPHEPLAAPESSATFWISPSFRQDEDWPTNCSQGG